MGDDATTTTRPRSGPPAGPRSAGLAVVLPPPAASVVDLGARRARSATLDVVINADNGLDIVDVTAVGRRPPAGPHSVVGPVAPMLMAAPEESTLSIQDRVRLRALEAAARAGTTRSGADPR